MEHDTSDQSSSDIHHGNTWRHQSLVLQSNSRDTSTLEKSMPNLQIDNKTINRINNTTTYVSNKHSRSTVDDDELLNARSSPDMISDTRCAQSPSDDYSPPAPSMPLALSDEAMLPQIRFSQNTPFPLPLSTLSTDGSSRLFDGRNRDLHSFRGNETSPLPLSISASNDNDRLFDGSNRNQNGGLHRQINKKMGVLIPSHDDEEERSIHDTLIHESISNSKCVPVEGKLADLSDNESSYSRDNDEEEGGIVILDESKEEDDESIHTSNRTQCIIESQVHNSQTSSMWEHDTILLDETNPISIDTNNSNNNRNESLTNFEQLLNQAGDTNQILLQEIEEDVDDEQSENDRDESSTLDDKSAASGIQFWQLNPFSSSNRNKKAAATINTATTPSSRHNTPIRSTRIRHDKFVIEVDITTDDSNTRLDVRDVLDIMANIELLHLWFDPVPAVFETLVKDGSLDNSTSIEEDNDHHQLENNHNREYDGQWVEISTPPLTIPSDSRVSGCMRAVRVGMRSLIGFPARIKSMIFVERSLGRIGMTLGPYPDGYLCTSGTTAYHTFTIRQRNDEESNSNGQCIVISDEVRLQRGVDSDFNGTVRNCCVCSFVRFVFGVLNVLFRWYQPDLASYMQQTISSMEKLRSLVERGESAAYSSSGEVVIDDDHGSAVNRVDETPLLGN